MLKSFEINPPKYPFLLAEKFLPFLKYSKLHNVLINPYDFARPLDNNYYLFLHNSRRRRYEVIRRNAIHHVNMGHNGRCHNENYHHGRESY